MQSHSLSFNLLKHHIQCIPSIQWWPMTYTCKWLASICNLLLEAICILFLPLSALLLLLFFHHLFSSLYPSRLSNQKYLSVRAKVWVLYFDTSTTRENLSFLLTILSLSLSLTLSSHLAYSNNCSSSLLFLNWWLTVYPWRMAEVAKRPTRMKSVHWSTSSVEVMTNCKYSYISLTLDISFTYTHRKGETYIHTDRQTHIHVEREREIAREREWNTLRNTETVNVTCKQGEK